MAKRTLVIGIDSGTQSTKVLVVDARSGKVLGSASQSYDLIPNLPPGEYGQLYVQYMEELYPVAVEVVGSRPPFDPDNERIRS